SHAFQREPLHCDVDHRFGPIKVRKTYKSWKKLSPMQMRSDFSRQRPIRLFGAVSDGLKMAGLWHRLVVKFAKKRGLGGLVRACCCSWYVIYLILGLFEQNYSCNIKTSD